MKDELTDPVIQNLFFVCNGLYFLQRHLGSHPDLQREIDEIEKMLCRLYKVQTNYLTRSAILPR